MQMTWTTSMLHIILDMEQSKFLYRYLSTMLKARSVFFKALQESPHWDSAPIREELEVFIHGLGVELAKDIKLSL